MQRLAILAALAVSLAACGGGNDGAEAGPGDGPEGSVVVLEPGGGDPVFVRVEVADDPDERSVGLMGRTELASDAGMVFIPDTPTSTSGFWMKNTLIPLSVAFWGPSGEILAILDMEPCERDPCPVYDPEVEWAAALEVNQGFFEERGIEVGDRARLER